MIFKREYTTLTLKAKVQADKDANQEMKDKEEKKTVVSDESFLNAELLSDLITELKLLRRK